MLELAEDRAVLAERAARLAEISAETAEWIATDLLIRQARDGVRYGPAADHIWIRAAGYREEARRHRVTAGLLAAGVPAQRR